MQADEKKFHIHRILYNCKGCINTPGCSTVFKGTTEQVVQHSLMTHRQADDIPFKCSVEGCSFATNNCGKIRGHLKIAHKLKTKDADDTRQYYTGTGINIPSHDLTELIPEEDQNEGEGSWKTVTSDEEIRKVWAQHDKGTKHHPTKFSQAFKKGPNERKRITITAYRQRKGKIQHEIKIQEATKSKGINGAQEVEEQGRADQGNPMKQTKKTETSQANTSEHLLQRKDGSQLASKYKKTTPVHLNEYQAGSTVCEDPSAAEQDTVSWYSDSAGQGEYDFFGKSPDTRDHTRETTHMDHTQETTLMDHPIETTHMDHPPRTTHMDHLQQTPHADNLSEWATDERAQQTTTVDRAENAINQDHDSTDTTVQESPPWQTPCDDISDQKYPIGLHTQKSVEQQMADSTTDSNQMITQLIKLNEGVQVMAKEMRRMRKTLKRIESCNRRLVGLGELSTQAAEAAIGGACSVYDMKFDIWAREYKEESQGTTESEANECDEEEQWRSSDENDKKDADN